MFSILQYYKTSINIERGKQHTAFYSSICVVNNEILRFPDQIGKSDQIDPNESADNDMAQVGYKNQAYQSQ